MPDDDFIMHVHRNGILFAYFPLINKSSVAAPAVTDGELLMLAVYGRMPSRYAGIYLAGQDNVIIIIIPADTRFTVSDLVFFPAEFPLYADYLINEPPA